MDHKQRSLLSPLVSPPFCVCITFSFSAALCHQSIKSSIKPCANSKICLIFDVSTMLNRLNITRIWRIDFLYIFFLLSTWDFFFSHSVSTIVQHYIVLISLCVLDALKKFLFLFVGSSGIFSPERYIEREDNFKVTHN